MKVYLCLLSIAILKSDFCADAALADEVNVQNQDGSSLAEDVINYDYPNEYDWMKDVPDSSNQDEYLFVSREKKYSKSEQDETIVDVSEIKEFDSNDSLDGFHNRINDLSTLQNDYKQFLESIINKYSSELDGYNNNNEKEEYINDGTLKNDYKHILRNILNNYKNIIEFFNNEKKQIYNLDIDYKLDHYKQCLNNIPNIYYNIMDGNNITKEQEDNFKYDILLDDYKQFLNKFITFGISYRTIICRDTSRISKDCIQYLNTTLNYFTKLMNEYTDKNEQEKNFNDVINDYKQYLNSFYGIHSDTMDDSNNKDVTDILNQVEYLFESGKKENSESLQDKTIVDVSEIKEFDSNDFLDNYFNQINDLITLQNDYKQFLESIINKYNSELDGYDNNNEHKDYINDGTLKNDYKQILRKILNNYNNIMHAENTAFEQIYNLDIDSKLNNYKQFLNNISDIYYNIMDGNNNKNGQGYNFNYDTLLDDYKQFLNNLITVNIYLRDRLINTLISKFSIRDNALIFNSLTQVVNNTINYYTKLMDGYSDKNELEENLNDLINDYKQYFKIINDIYSDILDGFNNKNEQEDNFNDYPLTNDYKQSYLSNLINKYYNVKDDYNKENNQEDIFNYDTVIKDYIQYSKNVVNTHKHVMDSYNNKEEQDDSSNKDFLTKYFNNYLKNDNIGNYYNELDSYNNKKGQDDSSYEDFLVKYYNQYLKNDNVDKYYKELDGYNNKKEQDDSFDENNYEINVNELENNNNEIDGNNIINNLLDNTINKNSYDLEDYIKEPDNNINSEPDYKAISNFRMEETNNDLIVPEDIANILLNMPTENKKDFLNSLEFMDKLKSSTSDLKIVKIKSNDSIVYVLSLDSLNQKKENTYYSNVDAENTVRRSSSTRGAILVVGIMLLALGSLFMIFIIKLRTRKNKSRASVSKCPEYESLPVQDV